MTAIITEDTRIFNANGFMNSFAQNIHPEWTSGEPYVIGDTVVYGTQKYVASSSGTAGVTPPTHISGVASDGTVDWVHVEPFANSSFFRNNIYMGIGKVTEWRDFSAIDDWVDATPYDVDDIVETPVDAGTFSICIQAHTSEAGVIDQDNVAYWTVITNETPLLPVDDDLYQYDILNNLLALKRITAADVNFAIIRYDWTSGVVYDQYDSDVDSFGYASPVYVMTAENNIYKCVDNNNGGQSTSQPTGTSIDETITGDGYVWKFMGAVSPSDAIKFLSTDYVPVDLKLNDDGSSQWDVQENAKKGSISSIQADIVGSGYTSAGVTISAPDQAGGVQATGVALLSGDTVTGFQLTNIGSGYTTTPIITVTGDGSNATASAILAPKDGHGANILQELNAHYVIVNTQLDDVEGGYFPIVGENDFRQISIVLDPLEWNGIVESEAIDTRYIGPDHDDFTGTGTGSNTQGEISLGSGHPIYVENIAPVVRSTGQIQDIKIIIKF